MGEGLTCLRFRCMRKRFLLNEILMMFPLHVKSTARRKLWNIQMNAGERHEISDTNTYQGKKLEQIILRNIAAPLEARPTLRGALLES